MQDFIPQGLYGPGRTWWDFPPPTFLRPEHEAMWKRAAARRDPYDPFSVEVAAEKLHHLFN